LPRPERMIYLWSRAPPFQPGDKASPMGTQGKRAKRQSPGRLQVAPACPTGGRCAFGPRAPLVRAGRSGRSHVGRGGRRVSVRSVRRLARVSQAAAKSELVSLASRFGQRWFLLDAANRGRPGHLLKLAAAQPGRSALLVVKSLCLRVPCARLSRSLSFFSRGLRSTFIALFCRGDEAPRASIDSTRPVRWAKQALQAKAVGG